MPNFMDKIVVMKEIKGANYKLPAEWIDRIFIRLADIFKEAWTDPLKIPLRLDILKTQWAGALYGLTSNEIRKAIEDCRYMHSPPTAMDFFKHAKSYRPTPPPKPIINCGDPEIAKKHIAEIKDKINGKCTGSTSETTLPVVSE